MALRIRYQMTAGRTIGYSVERLADALHLDFADMMFRMTPATPIAALAERSAPYAGLYAATIASTPQAQFGDGNYLVTVHDMAASNVLLGTIAASMAGGDDFNTLAVVPFGYPVVGTPTPTSIAFTLAGGPASGYYVGFRLQHFAKAGEAIITAHSVSGSTHTCTFDPAAPFPFAPAAGDLVYPIQVNPAF